MDIFGLLLSKYGKLFLEGAGVTLYMAFLSVLFGTLLGTLVYFLRQSKFKTVRFLGGAYVEIIRGTPVLLQIYMVLFVLPMVTGMELSKLYTVILALIFNSAAYLSEIIRAGIIGVDKGQWEASNSLGLKKSQTMIHIILPQAMKNILPALCNEFILIIKESSLGSMFFVGDLMTTQAVIKGSMYLVLEPLIIVGVIYFVMTFTLSKCVGILERRLSVSD